MGSFMRKVWSAGTTAKFLDGDDEIIVSRQERVVTAGGAASAGEDAEIARWDGEARREFRPMAGQIASGGTKDRDHEGAQFWPAGDDRALIGRAEHDHSADAPIESAFISLHALGHPPADDEVSEAVADEVDFVDAVEMVNDLAEILGVPVDRRAS
jgi:hypothetical protein